MRANLSQANQTGAAMRSVPCGWLAPALACSAAWASADGFFQMGDVFACHGDGDVEPFGGAGEAAALHDLAEDFHAQ